MTEEHAEQWEWNAVETALDPFSDIETEHLAQQIAHLYVLLAETLAPLRS